ncbi:unnamed protein product [Rotaria sp. Silwood2]|nr:unnamed protein product [Rotaria sp. Silwood2]CAF4071012.1 unnamed protein product [Rotaria sp. Silwood2]
MSLSTNSIRQSNLFQNYVRILQEKKDYAKVLLPTQPSSNISIDIPQADIQLRVSIPLTINETVTTNDFDNIVIFRYVQDFYEVNKLGKGAFDSVFRARNHLDNRMYAIKKIVFNDNTARIRRQAKPALRKVRVLASLSHPNIVQYHCAWLEFVPIPVQTRTLKQFDSLDELIQFEGQSSLSPENKKENEEGKSPQKSSTISTSQEDDEDGSEMSVDGINNKHSDLQIHHEYHSNGGNRSLSSSKMSLQHSASYCKRESNKELIPLHSRNELVHSIVQSNNVSSKIVPIIQMQLCDTTLHDWVHYRDQAIINEISEEKKNVFYSLNDLGQRQCWHIFKQLLTAVEYLHSQPFVHRDIKPRNIFLVYDPKDSSSVHVKLGDFGLATFLDTELIPDCSEPFPNDESTGVGTALYAPPEQLNSNHCIATPKSDSYSLGIVLFELFNIFPTEMKRYCCLSNLRINSKVDEQFSEYYPFETTIIEQLVSIESEKRPSVEQNVYHFPQIRFPEFIPK